MKLTDIYKEGAVGEFKYPDHFHFSDLTYMALLFRYPHGTYLSAISVLDLLIVRL